MKWYFKLYFWVSLMGALIYLYFLPCHAEEYKQVFSHGFFNGIGKMYLNALTVFAIVFATGLIQFPFFWLAFREKKQ